MIYQINGELYTFKTSYKDEDSLRASFNELTQLTFEFEFEAWYQQGYWRENYIPYSLLVDNKVVANVSVNVMFFDYLGEQKSYIQLGTVMTHPDYRHRGLSRFLMDKVMEDWQDKCEMIYLFANDEVLDFYPKFGFVKAEEYQFSKVVSSNIATLVLEKVDIADNTFHQQNLIYKIEKAKAISSLAMKNNLPLIMFYCMAPFAENIYYVKEYDAYVIAEFEEDIFYLQDVFCESLLDVNQLLKQITPSSIKQVKLGFVPFDKTGFDEACFVYDETTLFVWGKGAELFNSNKLMFPLLSHT